MIFNPGPAKRILISAHLWLFVAVGCTPFSFAHSLPSTDRLSVWKAINIGTFRSIINLREALEASECGSATSRNSTNLARVTTVPCRLGTSANEILVRPGFELSKTPGQLELVLVSGKDVGFRPDSQPSLTEIYERAVPAILMLEFRQLPTSYSCAPLCQQPMGQSLVRVAA